MISVIKTRVFRKVPLMNASDILLLEVQTFLMTCFCPTYFIAVRTAKGIGGEF